jgi:hypothetical protein
MGSQVNREKELIRIPSNECFATLELLGHLGITQQDFTRLRSNKKLAKEVAELIMSGKKVAADTYKVIVDYSMTLTEMISAGKYSYVNFYISDKHFPIQGAGQHKFELVLVHLNKDATTKEVLAHLGSNGLKAAGIEHLLAFGAANSDVQREFPIVALGSVWVVDGGDRRYPDLSCGGGRRVLNQANGDGDDWWKDNWRFLAIRK